MRCTQIYGLPETARKFIVENVEHIPEHVCPNCGCVVTNKQNWEVYNSAKDWGMFNDGPELLCYTLKNGRKVYEKVQAAPWSSGPCIFLQLVDGNDEVLFKWSKQSINDC